METSAESESSSWTVVTTDATFARDVLERSQQVPVVVDFWATWCGPCRILGPVLEKLADEYAGRFVLAKAETEQAPVAAEQMGVSSIPAVYAVVAGEVVDGFVGALPERQIRAWIDRLLQVAEMGSLLQLAETSPADAEPKLRTYVEQFPNNAELKIALAKALLALDRKSECQELIEQLADRGFLEPEAEKLKAALELGEISTEGLDDLMAAAKSNPRDLSLQIRLGESLAANQRYAEALESLLSVVQSDSGELREHARQIMVDIFRVLPGDSELVSSYRRKLSTALY